MNRFIGISGIFAILGIAYLLSNNKKKIQPRVIIWGLSLQILFGTHIWLKFTAQQYHNIIIESLSRVSY